MDLRPYWRTVRADSLAIVSTPTAAVVDVAVRGTVEAQVRRYAEETIQALVGTVREPVRHARVRLTGQADRGLGRPVVAQSSFEVNGRPVRSQVAASSGREAVDMLRQRLRCRLTALQNPGRVSCGQWPSVWGADRREPACTVPPAGERRIVRHKPVAPPPSTVDEAATELDLMDYDFYLFAERGSGQDSVLYRAWPSCFRLVQANPDPDRVQRGVVPLTIAAAPPPRLTVEQATHSMGSSDNRFLVFVDVATQRTCVLYRRYDGHYGLIRSGGAQSPGGKV